MTKEYSDYLAHHGIKGQKCGVRRYQNEDGTLTDKGRQRYLNGREKGIKEMESETDLGQRVYDEIKEKRFDSEYMKSTGLGKSLQKTYGREIAEKKLDQMLDDAKKKTLDAQKKAVEYHKRMTNLIKNNKDVKISDVERESKKLAKELGLDEEAGVELEYLIWGNYTN